LAKKSKDNVKARLDIETICDRPKLVMKTPADGKRWKKGPTDLAYFATAGLSSVLDLPHAALHVASSNVASGVLLVARGADASGVLGAAKRPCAVIHVALRYVLTVGLESV
jgi:hypothetical protein